MSVKKKFCMVEGGVHKVYHSSYSILNELFDLTVVARNAEKVKEVSDDIKYVKVKPQSFFLNKSFHSYKKIFSLLKKINPDKISVKPYYRFYSFLSLLYAWLYQKEIFIIEEQQNDPHSRFARLFFSLWLFLVRPLFNLKVKSVVCLTKPCYDYMKKKGFRKLAYMPTHYESDLNVSKINNRGNKLKIINVARFEWLKAHNVLVKAIDYLIRNDLIKRNEIEVNLIGAGGKLENQTRNLVKRYNLKDIFNFIGFIDNKVIDSFYQKNNLFVLSSRSEPIGMVVYEAMANGLPCIVSDKTGARCSVFPGVNGFIFESENYRDLAKKIVVMKDSNKRQNFGKASLKIIQEKHNFERIKQKYANVFD